VDDTFGDRRVRASAGRECLLTGDLGGDVVRLFVAEPRLFGEALRPESTGQASSPSTSAE